MKMMLMGHGYLGQVLSRLFQDMGWQVQTASLSGRNSDIACCVGDEAAVQSLPDADFVIHCASSAKKNCERSYQRVYVDGCRNLAHRYLDVPILFTSSSRVYGQTDGEIVTESCPANPSRERDQLLLNAEHIVLNAGGTVARLAGIYGPHRSGLLDNFLAGDAVIEGDGRRYLNHIHRDDAARAIRHMVVEGLKGIYNVTDSHPMHQVDCYRDLARIFGKPMPVSGPTSITRKRGWRNRRISNAKLRATGWEPDHISFVESAWHIINAEALA